MVCGVCVVVVVVARQAVKNAAELAGMREAHLRDAVALCDFLHFIETEVRAFVPFEGGGKGRLRPALCAATQATARRAELARRAAAATAGALLLRAGCGGAR